MKQKVVFSDEDMLALHRIWCAWIKKRGNYIFNLTNFFDSTRTKSASLQAAGLNYRQKDIPWSEWKRCWDALKESPFAQQQGISCVPMPKRPDFVGLVYDLSNLPSSKLSNEAINARLVKVFKNIVHRNVLITKRQVFSEIERFSQRINRPLNISPWNITPDRMRLEVVALTALKSEEGKLISKHITSSGEVYFAIEGYVPDPDL